MDLLKYNQEAWDKMVAEKNQWTIPVTPAAIESAKKGNWNIVLTPTKPVPNDWLPDLYGKKLLCLASGGGQQGPVLAAAGARVTVFDNSIAQLEQDQMVAEREGLKLQLKQGDMRDLSAFKSESFDIIVHPVSNCFINDVNIVWQECYRVLKSGGILIAGFCNPLNYIFDLEQWDKYNKLVVRYQIPFSDLDQLPKKHLEERFKTKEPLEYGHSLEDQIGGQIKAGFIINGFYEDKAGGDLLDDYINTFIATKSIKPEL